MNLKLLALPLALPLAFAAFPALASDWTLDPAHTDVGFKVRHMMVTDVKGAFDTYDGVISIDEKDPSKSKLDISIDIASVNTKNAKRDAHLKSADFFDAAKFPKMTFTSTKVVKGDKPGEYKVHGNLTIRGVTKPVVLDTVVTDAWSDPKEWGGNQHRGVRATTTINRFDYGLNWQTKLDKGGVVVGEQVTIAIDAELLEKKPPAKT
jgi:polyisoprenoid-binding protein YceI